jgi:XTP/dITP diphosphohydrolase
LTLNDFPAAPPVAEDGATFAANAGKKATALAQWLAAHPASLPKSLAATETTLAVLADDSGLEVDALDGAPGVHSARFAAMDVPGAGNSPDGANNAKLLRLMEKIPPPRRAARFRCALALARLTYSAAARKWLALPGRPAVLFEGACEGRILLKPAGAGGFGYDPLFVPAGHARSFAELGDAVKNSLSHRALALEKLRRHLAK